MNKRKLSAIVALVIIGLAASFFVQSKIRAWVAAGYWRRELAAAPEDRVEMVVRQVAELDAAGIPILVEALDCNRECVAQAAKQALFMQIERWRKFSADEYVSRSRILAEALVGEIDHFGPTARRDAMGLAARIVLRPLEDSGADADILLAACEQLLRTGLNTKLEPIRLKSTEIAGAARPKTENSIAAFQSQLSEKSESDGQPIADSTPLSVAGSFDKAILSRPQSGEDQRQAADSLANQPWLLDRQEASRPLGSFNRAPQASRIPDHAESAADAGRSAKRDKQIADSGRVGSLSHVDAEPAKSQLSSSLAAEEVDSLMRELNAENESRAEAVEAELLRRGFSALQIDLAQRLFDPDPAVRKKLVDDLPNLQGVEASPWLLRLCRDSDAGVRLAAITFLATSSDPAVLDEVEQIVRRDADWSIRRIGDRITQQRDARR